MPDEELRGPFDKPLPSVGIPLLREERQAVARRRIALALVALSAAGGATAAVLMLPGPIAGNRAPVIASSMPEAGMPDAGEADAATEDAGTDAGPTVRVETADEHSEGSADGPVTAGATTRTRHGFGRATAFRSALTHAGIGRADASALEEALTGVLDFRRCRPEHVFYVERDGSGNLVRFEYRTSATASEYAAVTRDRNGALRGERVRVPIERVRIARGGRVETSLGAALVAAGLRDSLVQSFVEAFRGKADFGHDARAGDTFRIVLEEERVHGRFVRYGRVHALEYDGGATGRIRAYYFAPERARGQFYDGEAREVDGSWLVFPCRFDRISSQFDPRRMHPVLRRIQPHNGTDFAAPTGTPVWAAAAGVVVWSGPKGPNGNLVSIQHDDGYTTHYAHLHVITAGIVRGARVAQRQSIGQVGTTGRSTGPHLHFGVKQGATFVDPMSILNGPGRQLVGAALAAFRRAQRDLDRELEAISVPAAAAPAPATPPPAAPAQ